MMAATPASPIGSATGTVNRLPAFAAATIALVAVGAILLSMVFTGPGDSRAIWISAAVAAFSQIAAFPLVRKLTRNNSMVGWGIGSLVRFGTLGAYAALAATVLHLPMTAALLSLALFYFLSMVIEPLFLRS